MYRIAAATVLVFVLLVSPATRGGEPSLDTLRQDLAQRYIEPEPHLALARYYHDKGNQLQAFRILEYARRQLFPDDQFNAAFSRHFLKREPFDNSKEAEAVLLKKHADAPAACPVVVKLADIYISRADWPQAKQYLAEAMKLTPEDFSVVEALAEVLRREGKAEEATRAVQVYVDKYPQSKAAYEQKIQTLMQADPTQAKAVLTEAIRKYPQEGRFAFNMGALLQRQEDLAGAEGQFVRAAAMAKDSAHIQGWTGRFFLKVKKDEVKALEYYLNAYFLDPHFYDSEYAEWRIGTISEILAQKHYESLVKKGQKPEQIVQDDNPAVVAMALSEMNKNWHRRYIRAAAEALGHDDEYVRARALKVLVAHADRSFDNDLKALLIDSDLRKRGMAGYLAVKLWGEEGIQAVKPWLKEDAQLLRYDAVSSLLLYGEAAGRKIVREHRANEKHPWFQRWLDAIDKQK